MNFLTKAFVSVLSTIALSAPAIAGSFGDIDSLISLIKQTGTTVTFNSNRYDSNCLNRAGYYSFKKDVTDLLVVCTDQVNKNDPDAVWETVSHEATHVMQACTGAHLFKPEFHPRIFRALSTKAPHYSKMIDTQYSGAHAIAEGEAFYMELQAPANVISVFKKACANLL